MDKRKVIPSMFHRRLVLLLSVLGAIGLVLGGQLFKLTIVEGSERLATAEAKLDQRTFLPTIRGNILDRQGRLLAIDRASYDVAVEYSVITGTWARAKASAESRTALGKNKWLSMSQTDKESAIQQRLPVWSAKCDRLWNEIIRLGKINPDDLQSRLDSIKSRVQSTAAVVWERQRRAEREQYGINADSDEELKARQPIAEQDRTHIILTRVPDEVAFEFRRIAQEMPGMLEVQDSHRREYPWLNAEVNLQRNSLPLGLRTSEPVTIPVIGVADHILGGMRDGAWESDAKRRPFRDPKTGKIDLGWYEPTDSVGTRGLERVFEDYLRGSRGEIRSRRDTKSEIRTPPMAGKDVRLTIDIALQARVQAILSPQYGLARVQPWQHNTVLPVGTPLNAAAVVIEIETGEVLALVSMPTIAMGDLMSDEQKLTDQPLVNRAVDAMYPPGSIVKPLVLAAAATEGVFNLAQSIECKGHYFDSTPTIARCWINREKYAVKNHGALEAEEALARSCNMFFYTLGDRLGIERLCKWFRLFGMGEMLHVGLGYSETGAPHAPGEMIMGESTGIVPNEAQIEKFRDQKRFNQVIMGIGQGPIAWTPVQAANSYATLARGGTIRDATIVLNDPRGSRPPRCTDLNLNERAVDMALEGLRQSVEERHGTGHHINHDSGESEPIINAQGVKVSAKTGTAQASPLRMRDTNGDGRISSKDDITYDKLDHSWFVGLVGPRTSPKPLHAIAVLVENGGSGGRTAGPIANQIIRALQAEGYLPGDANVSAAGQSKAPRDEPEPVGEDH